MMTSKIPTFAEVSRTFKRNRTFAGKPRPIRSGVSLVKVPPVAHRSHVLLDDQIELVRGIQDELQHAMESLSTCKSESEAVYWKDMVDALRTRSEDMVLILKVVSKLSRELIYAKLELEHVTKEGGDVMEVRKRVVWLEDRMEALLSRYREEDSARSTPMSSRETISQASASSGQLNRGSTPKPIEYNPQAGGDAGVKVQKTSVVQHETHDQSKYEQPAHTPGFGPDVFLTSHFRGKNEDEEQTSSEEEDENSEEYSSTSDEDGENERQNNKTEGVFLTEGSNSEGGSAHTRKITFSPDVSIERYNETNEDDDEDEEDAVTKYWENPHHKFEFSEQRQVITRENPLSYHNLGLAVQSSFIERAPATPSDLPWRPIKKASDMGDAQLLVRETNKLDSESQKFLKQSPRFPVKKIALDKLSERIHDIWGKMEDAAMMSIEVNTAPSQATNRRPESRLSASSPAYQMQLESRKSALSRTRTSKTISATGTRSPVKSVSLPPPPADNLPPVEASRHASVVPTMTYYPPAIPKPQVLPIPRTNSDKRYPRISSDWNELLPEDMPSTMRLVNQMNIAKETKITLFKKKEKVKKPAAKLKTSGRRWKIARNPIQTAAQVAAIVSDRRKISTTRLDKDSLQWMRIQELLQKLVSERVEERRDAAMHLGVLDCSDEGIMAGLTYAIVNDKDDKVKYNATKALVLLGHWSQPAMAIIVKCIKDGPYGMQKDLVRTLIHARNVHLVNKSSVLGKQLIDKLKQLCASKKDAGDLGYESAVCLGCMGVRAPVAKLKLMTCLQSTDTNLVCKSLEVLIRQMRATEPSVIHMVLHQFEKSALWKHRAAAAKLLVLIGAHHLLLLEDPDTVFKILEQRLFDDPSREVRQEVAVTLTSLGMKDRVVAFVEKRLEDEDDDTRAHAVTAAGVLGMRSDRIIRQLLEMLELDSCEYVRLQVIRTFATLGLTNIKIMRSLRERERQEGPLAREATKALKVLNGRKTAMGHRSPVHK